MDSISNGMTNNLVDKNSKLRKLLFDDSEEIVSVLGNGIAKTFLSTGVLGNGFAVLSDQRVYFRGKCLIRLGKGFYRKLEEKTVDISDVTGSGFVHNKALWAKILYIVSIVIAVSETLGALIMAFAMMGEDAPSDVFMGLLGAVALTVGMSFVCRLIYKMFNYSAFEINYAGGGIAFGLHWISTEEAKEFQRALALLKDSRKMQECPSQWTVIQWNSMARLIPENNLKEKGVICNEKVIGTAVGFGHGFLYDDHAHSLWRGRG